MNVLGVSHVAVGEDYERHAGAVRPSSRINRTRRQTVAGPALAVAVFQVLVDGVGGDAESSGHRCGGEPLGRQLQHNEFARCQSKLRRARWADLTPVREYEIHPASSESRTWSAATANPVRRLTGTTTRSWRHPVKDDG